jgi:CHAT domain-containing protein
MLSPLQNQILRQCLFICLSLLIFSSAYCQESQADKEIDEAIENAQNGNCEEALPVLEKYSKKNRFEDLKKLEINVSLNWCYLITQNGALDVETINKLTGSYIEKYGISKTSKLRSKDEMKLFLFAGIINHNVGNNETMLSYLSPIIRHYDENLLVRDEFLSSVLYVMALGHYHLFEYDSAIKVGKTGLKLCDYLWGEINKNSHNILDVIYKAYYKNNEPQMALEYLNKKITVGNKLFGKKNLDYLSDLNTLAVLYSDYGERSKALEIHLRVLDLRKKVLGEKHRDYLESISNISTTYSLLGEHQKALEFNMKAEELGNEILGEKERDFIIILNNQASINSELGNYKKALEISQKVAELLKEVLGENDPEYFTSLSNLSIYYSQIGDYKKALEIDLELLELRQKVLGTKHPDYLTSLSSLAQSFSNIGNYRKALELSQKVVELRKEVLGEKHPDYLSSLSNLSVNYQDVGDYILGIEISKKVVELRKEVLGEKHPDYLVSLNNLAVNYLNLGFYSKALEVSLNVVESYKAVLGEKHPDYLTSLENLAVQYSELGDYIKALEIKQQVLELRREILGDRHPDFLNSLTNLSIEYLNLGDYQKALGIDLKGIELCKAVLGENHPNCFQILNSLATDYFYLQDNEKSLQIYGEVVESRKEVFGEKHPDYLTSLGNLAIVYRDIGNYHKSLEISKKVVELRKEVLGEKHPDYIGSLNNIAVCYSKLNYYLNSLEVHQEVLELRKEVLGENHPLYIESLNNIADTELHLSENNIALNYFTEMLDKTQEKVFEYFTMMTEKQRHLYWEKYGGYFNYFPRYYEKTSDYQSEGAIKAYEYSLLTKGILLNTTIDFDKLIAEKGTPEAIAKFEELKLLKLQIQRISEKPIAERYLNVDSLENIAQKKETELVKLSKEYGDYTRNLKITWKDVQGQLSYKDVAIEFVEYPTLTDTVKYAALVLRKEWQYPRMIPLFRKDQIEEFISQEENDIYSNEDVGKQIKKLVWEPLEEVIAPGERVYFSPAGILHQLAIENLPASDSTTLEDRYQLFRLSSTKELVIHNATSKYQSAVLYGGLEYDMEEDKMLAESNKYEYEKSRSYQPLRGYSDSQEGWGSLGHTLMEVEDIAQKMQEKQYPNLIYTGRFGNEESFKSLSGKNSSIIHIATHGFFSTIEESKETPFIMQRLGDQQQDKPFIDPMLRSGLIMAGGNKAWLGEKVPDNIEDGVLTAREISHMDLRGTDLVVLSACETGLGEVSSEGVFGLQRSFKQAGVQTILMSLWEVKDLPTRYMMTEFYSNLLNGKEKREAFLEAKRKCRDKYPEPENWAAFIMLN